MGLNIKNERVHSLAREAARVTGGSQTSAIEQALEALLRERGHDPRQADRDARIERMLEMGARFRREERPISRGITKVEELYDEKTGLPR
ncbi:MAG: type II toxin-antitoxin system VapB family antitoxin [Microbacteriaceae bacterium]|uniref:type II toxin-antitoxin system VapB family antitoxin n=1 Tax=Microbacterium sp. TaxID=51671 RepID=UPI003F9C0D6E